MKKAVNYLIILPLSWFLSNIKITISGWLFNYYPNQPIVIVVNGVFPNGKCNSEPNLIEGLLIKNGIKCTVVNDINSALAMMKEQVNKDKPGLIFGSHYIAKAVFKFFSFSFDKGTI